MKLTYYGQSCFLIETAGHRLLFDPFISHNPLAMDIDINSIEADFILVSHGHGDHIADLVPIANRTGARIITIIEVGAWIKNQGVAADKVEGMNFGSAEFPFGRLSLVPAWHSSSNPDGSYGGNPGGFVIKNEEGAFYYSGDTCLMMDMHLISHYAKPDFAIFPIGGYFTMDYKDALKAAEFVGVERVVGVHYNTFPPIEIDTEEAKRLFNENRKQLLLPAIGTTIEF
jgi:L-ascorbate metabolism protein UlaG (beta-lactamase superfamily)